MNKRTYDNIRALDFEMFNTKHYWSICWAGVAVADENLQLTGIYDRIINPMIKEKFIGNTMTLPFNYSELKSYPAFDGVADEIFGHINGALVIGHALENDIKMIADVSKKFNLKCPEFDFIDTNICYNAAKGTVIEHSLTKLAEEFEIEFCAHNPAEDARAALEIIKKLSCGNIYSFLDNFGITVGKFKNGLIRRGYYDAMPARQRERIFSYNCIYDAVEKFGQGGGESYFIVNPIAMEQDMRLVAAAILNAGGRLSTDSYCADITVTNDLYLCKTDFRTITLRETVEKYNLDTSVYDYTPKKVVGTDGKGISYQEYLNEHYKDYCCEGKYSGKLFCFSKDIERRHNFPEIVKNIFASGGKLTARMETDAIFVVESLSDINNNFTDGRIIAFKRAGSKQKLLTLAELGL